MKAYRNIKRKYYKYVSTVREWTQPIISSDGVLGGYSFAVYSGGETAHPAWHACDNNSSTFATLNGENMFILYNPTPVKPNYIRIINRNYPNYYIQAGNLYGSNDGNVYSLVKTFTSSVGGRLAVFDLDTLENQEYYKYWKIQVTSANAGAWQPSTVSLMDATERVTTVEEATQSDYDYYVDRYIYKLPKVNNKYYGIN